MVHTAKFFIQFENEEVYKLEEKYKENITLVSEKLNEKHNGITSYFTNYNKTWFMYFTIDFIRLLDKVNIKESDYKEIEDKINKFIYEVFGVRDKEAILVRIDYRLDVKVEREEERVLLFHLYKKTIEKYRFQKKYDKYGSTVYFNNKSVQATIYDKEKERYDKGEGIEEYEENVLRFEVRLQNRHLNSIKHSKKIENRLEKELKHYFKEKLYEKYMKQYFGHFLYKGNYYKMYRCEKIIANSNLSDKDKKELREFLIKVSKVGMQKVKSELTTHMFKKHIKQLELLQINPIIIPKNYKIDLPKGYITNPFLEA